ncbi:MAG TPA: hypothetical protein VJ739_10405 [Gemmataceae bacterium]|nr:hypothetical protein [Gemmataceae bacterium]
MPTDPSWLPTEPDLAAAFRVSPRPLDALAAAEVPAIVLRGAYPSTLCEALYRRLLERGLLHDPAGPVPEHLREAGIPEGYYREGRQGAERRAWQEQLATGKLRIDVGTSLGYRGSDPDGFFAHSAETHRLFTDLFAGLPSPVRLIYDRLADLAPGKRVVTAHEPDGRRYGPAIIRAHYGGYTYRPHFDSVRLREKRDEYAVVRFEHQLAGVLVLRNSERDGPAAGGTLHRYLWQPEVQPYLDAGTFHDFARQRGIGHMEIRLEPGDLYFFSTRLIHEVPGVAGVEPRVVLATFIGYSPGDEEIFVWS